MPECDNKNNYECGESRQNSAYEGQRISSVSEEKGILDRNKSRG